MGLQNGKTSNFIPSFLSCWFLIIHLLFLTAAVGLAETSLNTKIIFLSGHSSGPTTVHVKLGALKLSLLLCIW